MPAFLALIILGIGTVLSFTYIKHNFMTNLSKKDRAYVVKYLIRVGR